MASKKTLLQPPKGFRDFLPQEAMKRGYVISAMIRTFELFGFQPLETPALEYASVLEGKYGEEEKLIFKFEDRGKRELALRFDQTIPTARVVAQYADQLPTPFKRYQIQPAWRAEKPQAGRFREFLQCDADIIGTDSPLADAEILALADKVLQVLGVKKYLILFNDRRVLSRMIKSSGIKAELELPIIRILDKLEKVGEEAVLTELENIGVASTKIEQLMTLLGKRPVLPGKKIQEVSLEEIESITRELKKFGVSSKKVLYTPTLARGLDYYTGLIFEVTINGYEVGSVCGGGRYDNLIGMYAGKSIPAVGFAFGIDRMIEALDLLNLFPVSKTQTKVLVTIFNQELANTSASLTTELRNQQINAELYLNPFEKLDKQIKYADKKSIPFVVIIGPDEAENNQVTIKNLDTEIQETIPQDQLLSRLQK